MQLLKLKNKIRSHFFYGDVKYQFILLLIFFLIPCNSTVLSTLISWITVFHALSYPQHPTLPFPIPFFLFLLNIRISLLELFFFIDFRRIWINGGSYQLIASFLGFRIEVSSAPARSDGLPNCMQLQNRVMPCPKIAPQDKNDSGK